MYYVGTIIFAAIAVLVVVVFFTQRSRRSVSHPDPTAVVPQPRVPPRSGGTEILLIRHGRSDDVVPGSPESHDPPLHVEGRRQAAALAARLDGKKLDAVVASHLLRAVQTAQAVADPRGMSVEVIEDLQEVILGDWGAGEFRRRAAALDPEFLAWASTGRWDGIPGGEGDAVLRARVRLAIDSVAARHPGGSVAVVAHGGVIGAYLADVLGIHRSLWLGVENTSITVVHVGPDGATVVVANDCSHLYDPVHGPPA